MPALALAEGAGTPQGDSGNPRTMFPHTAETRWWVSGQVNTILQGHPSFVAQYTGANSLKPDAEIRDSRVMTLFTGLGLTRYTEGFLDLESAGGGAISDALGLASLTNADVVRNPSLGAKPYVARIMVRQIIALSHELADEERGPLSLATKVPVRRLEFRAGKFAIPDFFDRNDVGSDAHLQFINLTMLTNGGFEYAGNTRGYSYGVLVECHDRLGVLRFSEALMPRVPNGIDLEWNLRRARAETLEVEWRGKLFGRHSAARLLSYMNHANRGDYRKAVDLFREGKAPRPLIESTRLQGQVKYGFGVNVEREITDRSRAFGRFGWNDPRHESFEVNRSLAFGADYRGDRWGRARDRVGLALVTNAISKDLQEYLNLGGRGLFLGDGTLNYGRENIVEAYYNGNLWRGFYAALDLQHVQNPGYNRDRGPVWVLALRLHIEL
jgi:high affinity Mn2+ porin